MPEAVVQLLSFFEASTLCKDECNFEWPTLFYTRSPVGR